jgi:hypothetical protein
MNYRVRNEITFSFTEASTLKESIKKYDLIIEVCGVREALVGVVKSHLNEGGIVLLVGLCHPDSDLKGLSADLVIRKCATVVGKINCLFHNSLSENMVKKLHV